MIQISKTKNTIYVMDVRSVLNEIRLDSPKFLRSTDFFFFEIILQIRENLIYELYFL